MALDEILVAGLDRILGRIGVEVERVQRLQGQGVVTRRLRGVASPALCGPLFWQSVPVIPAHQ